MTESEKVICKAYLEDLDKNRSCNEYKLLMELLEQEPCEDCISRKWLLNRPLDIANYPSNYVKQAPPIYPIRPKGK